MRSGEPVIRELKFWARDILRGPHAKTPLGFYVSSIGGGLIFGGLVLLTIALFTKAG